MCKFTEFSRNDVNRGLKIHSESLRITLSESYRLKKNLCRKQRCEKSMLITLRLGCRYFMRTVVLFSF